jgi:hypothetical protein
MHEARSVTVGMDALAVVVFVLLPEILFQQLLYRVAGSCAHIVTRTTVIKLFFDDIDSNNIMSYCTVRL